MYVLHIANKNYSSWSLRPWSLLTALGIPFEEQVHPFQNGPNYAEFRKFSPTGCVPALHDGATVAWDSLGITGYLADRHDAVWPADQTARDWARCAVAEMHSGFSALRDRCTMNVGLRIRLKDMPAALVADIARIAELWSEGISRFGGPFLAGRNFTAVDAFFAPVVFRAQTYGILTDKASAGYTAHMLDQPALKSWQDSALKETWREAGHEADARATGTWTADLRAG